MKLTKFTNLERESIASKLKTTWFDLVIIGGGITGAGILLDAASRGMKVALIEKGDFASGTSSKSTKLIHGGLRYLKQFDFWLVKEVGSERAIVHKLAPHLVIPEKMLLPLIENGNYGKWLTSIGLKVYDILANVDEEDERKMLDKKEALDVEPLLPEKILKGAGYYAEYRTDDARLTLENIKTSLQYNSVPVNYTNVTGFLYENEKVSGLKAQDEITGEKYEIRSKLVVNATGPWVDEIRDKNHSKKGKQLHLTKGVHLVFPHRKLPVKQSVYFDVPDGRMIFAIPRGKITYVGTTDTNYHNDKNNIDVDTTDAIYLITAVNNMFPGIHLTMEDVISSWAGLRPLIHEEGKSPSELSRKDEIFISGSGLISIAGGKLTGYRKMAERTVNTVARQLEDNFNIKTKKCKTEKIGLNGGPWLNYKEVNDYINQLKSRVKPYGFSDYTCWYLTGVYGKQTEEILSLFNKLDAEDNDTKLILAELHFCIRYELINTPLDFFIRRTGRMYFDIDSVNKYTEAVLKEYKSVFNADDEMIDKFRKEIQAEIIKHSKISD
ncbi:glycerol-3-phosphate dehydrogenase/oxidase [Abyssalbus ytuae]|uniref:Glycerol-3-phosphate dehydrogenase/oxidase n=1 Tax=Abyssalbus ytuae TaxID=2926907 RepID=A0A9E7CUZ9_9FLAO|nr:glycerol-3-phosphate dehydrogenase/oxidase [Abyssalbus ytuae]UOB19197.1 glycerol-3-phosphate dehydrogenase/oxidase [Abyssalbus ytuae]